MSIWNDKEKAKTAMIGIAELAQLDAIELQYMATVAWNTYNSIVRIWAERHPGKKPPDLKQHLEVLKNPPFRDDQYDPPKG